MTKNENKFCHIHKSQFKKMNLCALPVEIFQKILCLSRNLDFAKDLGDTYSVAKIEKMDFLDMIGSKIESRYENVKQLDTIGGYNAVGKVFGTNSSLISALNSLN